MALEFVGGPTIGLSRAANEIGVIRSSDALNRGMLKKLGLHV
jgi:hypothetical protein